MTTAVATSPLSARSSFANHRCLDLTIADVFGQSAAPVSREAANARRRPGLRIPPCTRAVQACAGREDAGLLAPPSCLQTAGGASAGQSSSIQAVRDPVEFVVAKRHRTPWARTGQLSWRVVESSNWAGARGCSVSPVSVAGVGAPACQQCVSQRRRREPVPSPGTKANAAGVDCALGPSTAGASAANPRSLG